jgi:hypothetical protein
VDGWIPEDHIARFVAEIVDNLDISMRLSCQFDEFDENSFIIKPFVIRYYGTI